MKKINKLDISVVICTYNEEKNIASCIRSVKENFPREIIVVDGGSGDGTMDLAKNLEVKVLKTEKGLAHQRQVGVDSSKAGYIAFVDADDHLDVDCLNTLIKEMAKYSYDGIQARTLSFEPRTYWQKAMDLNLRLFISKPGVTNMLGRPAIYRKSVFRKVHFDSRFVFASEDTDLSRQMELTGFIQGVGTGISHRDHPSTARECFKQWLRYGRGDAIFSKKYPERLKGILYHLLVNYPIKKSWVVLKNGDGLFAPFFILQGYTRLIGFFAEYFKN